MFNVMQVSGSTGGQAFSDSCTLRGPDADCTIVPEPGTCLLMLTGILGLGFVGWRRRETLV